MKEPRVKSDIVINHVDSSSRRNSREEKEAERGQRRG